MPRQRGGFRSPSPRRLTDWGFGPATTDQAMASSGKFGWLTGVVPLHKSTIVRTRGLVTVTLLSANVAGDGFFGAHGICVVSEDAFAVGQTAIPHPLDDSDSDMWIWHSFFDVRASSGTFTEGVNAAGAVSRIEIDSKAMRRNLDETKVLVGISAVVESGAATADLNAETRMLFKL